MAAQPAANGFDQFGYNMKAMIFVGTGESWYMGKLGVDHLTAEAAMGSYAHDKLVMKWSEAWHMAIFGPDGIRENGDELPWTTDAWEDNEWNGRGPCKDWDGTKVTGSGEVWHYKIKWFDNSVTQYPEGYVLPDGGYVLWGSFEVLMDQGSYSDHTHEFLAKAVPCGYGT